MTHAAKWLAAVALLLSGCIAVAAQNAPASGQDKGQEPPPVADAGTTAQANCINENDHYKMSGRQPMFVIELTNKCEQRITCKVFAYINSARGPAQGRGTIVLAPKSRGAAAKSTYTMKTKMVGGNSISDRECRPL
jgi:hypothetical protein